jgi:hypothetical protein
MSKKPLERRQADPLLYGRDAERVGERAVKLSD